MKSLSLMLRVEATSPPTLTDAPLPNRMPLGFSRNTLPLAERLPMILEGSEPNTRLSATELLLGCKKLTVSPRPIPKVCQLIATFCVDWVMVVLAAWLLMAAPPAVTTPPPGSAEALVPYAIMRAIVRALMAPLDEAFLPELMVYSETLCTPLLVMKTAIERAGSR